MKNVLLIILTFLFFSCSEKSKTKKPENILKKLKVVSNNEISHQNILDSIKLYKIKPTDSLVTTDEIKPLVKYRIEKNEVEIFKKDSFNISWIKINSKKYLLNNLKTINARTDGENENMFCNYLEKIKLYRFESNELIFMEFSSNPCTGLGCSVSDYIIYCVNKKQLNLFGSFRTANVDLYKFPFNSDINYIGSEYQGDFHGNTPVHFIDRIYSMNKNGEFYLTKDKNNKELFYEVITYPNKTKDIEYKSNWFATQ